MCFSIKNMCNKTPARLSEVDVWWCVFCEVFLFLSFFLVFGLDKINPSRHLCKWGG